MLSQSAIAYQKIKEMIFRMEFLPGSRISELQLATKLSISRTPIHDALRRLESEGLVTLSRNRGASVASYTDDEIREIGMIRLIQDLLSVQLASYYGCAADFDHLNQLADKCEAAATSGDIYGRIQTDIEFHMAIAEMSANSRLVSQQRAIYQQVHLIQASKYTDIQQSLFQIHHHRPLVAAMRAGALDKARSLCCQHIKDFFHIDPYLLKCYESN